MRRLNDFGRKAGVPEGGLLLKGRAAGLGRGGGGGGIATCGRAHATEVVVFWGACLAALCPSSSAIASETAPEF